MNAILFEVEQVLQLCMVAVVSIVRVRKSS